MLQIGSILYPGPTPSITIVSELSEKVLQSKPKLVRLSDDLAATWPSLGFFHSFLFRD
jgi:hypothetical protein